MRFGIAQFVESLCKIKRGWVNFLSLLELRIPFSHALRCHYSWSLCFQTQIETHTVSFLILRLSELDWDTPPIFLGLQLADGRLWVCSAHVI